MAYRRPANPAGSTRRARPCAVRSRDRWRLLQRLRTEIHALNNPYYNIEGLGIRFVASPRHADMLLVTGPLTLNMREAVRRAYEATPHPKLVIATGECACTG